MTGAVSRNWPPLEELNYISNELFRACVKARDSHSDQFLKALFPPLKAFEFFNLHQSPLGAPNDAERVGYVEYRYGCTTQGR